MKMIIIIDTTDYKKIIKDIKLLQLNYNISVNRHIRDPLRTLIQINNIYCLSCLSRLFNINKIAYTIYPGEWKNYELYKKTK